MTAQPRPPEKRRRRWLIVALLLVLVPLVSWWNWPRGDARFVGKWAVYKSAVTNSPSMYFDLRPNGHGQSTKPDGLLWARYLWETRGDTFVMGVFSESLPTPPSWLSESVRVITNNHAWRIVRQSDDEIVLADTLGPGQIVLKRIPE